MVVGEDSETLKVNVLLGDEAYSVRVVRLKVVVIVYLMILEPPPSQGWAHLVEAVQSEKRSVGHHHSLEGLIVRVDDSAIE